MNVLFELRPKNGSEKVLTSKSNIFSSFELFVVVSTVLGRRRATIVAQDYDVDQNVITLKVEEKEKDFFKFLTLNKKATLPVRESFGLYGEMIASSSGKKITKKKRK